MSRPLPKKGNKKPFAISFLYPPRIRGLEKNGKGFFFFPFWGEGVMYDSWSKAKIGVDR
jgi:hypothetical protein